MGVKNLSVDAGKQPPHPSDPASQECIFPSIELGPAILVKKDLS